jgi:succinoglycan biosynthesis protein ExoO
LSDPRSPAAPGVAPKVTVAIPVYNSAATLERCIGSAARQTLRDIEILVADDGSQDGSAQIAEEFARRDPRIRVIRLWPNKGKPTAMNTLVAAARGEWVAVLDADDAYHEERLEHLVSAAEMTGSEMVADNIYYVDAGAGQVVRTAFDTSAPARFITKESLAANSDSYAEFDYGVLKPVIKRSFLIDKGLTYFEGIKLAEDYYYLLSFLVSGGRGYLVSKPLYYWTMAFGTISRRWTETGNGAWRYDYNDALRANEHFIREMRDRSEDGVVRLLEARSRRYKVMIHYLGAQRLAADGRGYRAVATIAGHPSTWPLLVRRVAGRLARWLRGSVLRAEAWRLP